jgi:hypothetical protein
VADREVAELPGGSRQIGVPPPGDAQRALAARRVEMEPADRRPGRVPGHGGQQPDAYPGADQAPDGVRFVAFAGDDGRPAERGEQLVGQGPLPVAGPGGDEWFGGQVPDTGRAAPEVAAS